MVGESLAHKHHEGKAKKQKDQATNPVLNADDFVIGGKNVFPPKTQFVMAVIVPCFVMLFAVRCV